jgi:rubrerythrin
MPDAELALLADRLTDRLAHEQLGACYYAVLASKANALTAEAECPVGEGLEELVEDERGLVQLLRDALIEFGGEPDSVRSLGTLDATVEATRLLAVVADPHRSISDSLEAVLAEELRGRESWQTLAELAAALGHRALAERCAAARDVEDGHVRRLREWLARRPGGTRDLEREPEGDGGAA